MVLTLREAEAWPAEERWLTTALSVAKAWQTQAGGREADGGGRLATARNWVVRHLEEAKEHSVLVFSQELSVVTKFASLLNAGRRESIAAVFHHRQSAPDQAAAALDFQQGRCRVLVSDELGGEGRNFQNASAVVHLDVPWSVGRLEQRIGRLDRLGRAPNLDVVSVVLRCVEDSFGQSLLRLHASIFRVFEHSIGGLEFGLPAIQELVNEALLDGPQKLTDLFPTLEQAVTSARRREDDAFEFAIDSSRDDLEEGQEFAKEASDYLTRQNDGPVLLDWARKLGVGTSGDGHEAEVKIDPDRLVRHVPDNPYSGRVVLRGTFDHRVALADESVQFFAPGHPFVEFLVHDWRTATYGRASASFRDLGARARGRAFAIILVRSEIQWGDSPLAAALRLHAARFVQAQTESCLFELFDGSGASPSADVHDPVIRKALLRAQTAPGDNVTPATLNRLIPLAQLWTAVASAEQAAVSIVRMRRQPTLANAIEQLRRRFSIEAHALVNDGNEFMPEFQNAARAIQDEVCSVEAIQVVVGH
jgi:ATP-dependent helicase HepA